MNPRREFIKAMNFKKPDERLPAIEWAKWWEPTIERWEVEGMPKGLDADAIKQFFGLDDYARIRYRTLGSSLPDLEFGQGIVKDTDDYLKIKSMLFPKDQVAANLDRIQKMKRNQEEGMVSWVGIDGFFWFPRQLFGIEEHLYAFYDYPELMHRMNRDLLEYNVYLINETAKYFKPDFVTISEDMSYNHGSMISKNQFDEFIKPYYLELIPAIRRHGILTVVDSDGDVTELIGWLMECGVEGILPLERQSGVDVARLRKMYPGFRMIGGFDKTVLHKGEKAIREEFERLLPVMKSRGFIPSIDHQTPPDVSIENYKIYVSLLKEYARKARE